MPHRIWRHVCQGRALIIASPDCAVCGSHGAFGGWRLSTLEAASLYQYVYGLDPFGPHRRLADRLLAPLRTSCVRCGGEAVLTIDVVGWRSCPTCEGTGGVWNRSAEEVEAVRQQILAWPSHPQPVPPEEKGSPSRSTRRRKGYSSDGLSFAEVERAFAEAERILGTDWRLKGRGHCRRATLERRYSKYALRGAAGSVVHIVIGSDRRPKRILPMAIIEKAAEILRVLPSLLVTREY